MTPKELLFCEAYLRLRDQKKAAEEAGYSSTTAAKMAGDILRRPHVKAYINQLTKKVTQVAVADATTVINSYAAIAFASPFDCLTYDEETGLWEGLPPDQIPDAVKPAIKDVRIVEVKPKGAKRGEPGRQVFKYELYDKMNALERLGKHFHVFDESPSTVINLNQYSNIPTEKLQKLEEAFKDVLEGDFEEIPADDAAASDDSNGLGNLLAEPDGERGRNGADDAESDSSALGDGESDLYRKLGGAD